MRPLTDKALRWLTFSPSGAVTVDLNAALRSTEGRRQLAKAWEVARRFRRGRSAAPDASHAENPPVA